MVKYTEQECVAFNSLLHDYLKIDSDSALEERGLSYEDYKEMGLDLDTLRFDKAVCTNQTRARYFLWDADGVVWRWEMDCYISGRPAI